MNRNKICHCTLPYIDPSACSRCGTQSRIGLSIYYCRHGVQIDTGCPQCEAERQPIVLPEKIKHTGAATRTLSLDVAKTVNTLIDYLTKTTHTNNRSTS